MSNKKGKIICVDCGNEVKTLESHGDGICAERPLLPRDLGRDFPKISDKSIRELHYEMQKYADDKIDKPSTAEATWEGKQPIDDLMADLERLKKEGYNFVKLGIFLFPDHDNDHPRALCSKPVITAFVNKNSWE